MGHPSKHNATDGLICAYIPGSTTRTTCTARGASGNTPLPGFPNGTNTPQPGPQPGPQNTPRPGANGALSCTQLFECVNGCANNDNPCFEGCINSTSPTAQQLANAYMKCAETNGCNDANCAQQMCSAEYNGCLNDGGAAPNPGPGSSPAPQPNTAPSRCIELQGHGRLHYAVPAK